MLTRLAGRSADHRTLVLAMRERVEDYGPTHNAGRDDESSSLCSRLSASLGHSQIRSPSYSPPSPLHAGGFCSRSSVLAASWTSPCAHRFEARKSQKLQQPE